MKILFIVNDVQNIDASNTTALIGAAAARGWPTAVSDITTLSCGQDGRVQAQVRWLPEKTAAVQATLRQRSAEQTAVTQFDVILLRTNPARDPDHQPLHRATLDLLELAADQGVPVHNSPAGLRRASSKLYVQRLPAHARPATLVSVSRPEIIAFVEQVGGRAVLKPISGTRGRDVFFVNSVDDPNLNQIIEVLTRQGMVMAQEFLPAAAEGDTRVLVLNGRLLQTNGATAAYRRVPAPRELRSNIHAGGHAAPATLTPELRQLVADVGPQLRQDGLFLVGLDVIDNRIIEVNCFSPGGMLNASAFQDNVDFFAPILDAIEQQSR